MWWEGSSFTFLLADFPILYSSLDLLGLKSVKISEWSPGFPGYGLGHEMFSMKLKACLATLASQPV